MLLYLGAYPSSHRVRSCVRKRAENVKSSLKYLSKDSKVWLASCKDQNLNQITESHPSQRSEIIRDPDSALWSMELKREIHLLQDGVYNQVKAQECSILKTVSALIHLSLTFRLAFTSNGTKFLFNSVCF